MTPLTPSFADFLHLVQKAVKEYRLRSPAHFALPVGANAVPGGQTEGQLYEVQFGTWTLDVSRLCRYRHGQVDGDTAAAEIEVKEGGKWVDLEQILSKNFPIQEEPVGNDVMQKYWEANGKSFSWQGLPTELKAHVIQFCICSLDPWHYDIFHGRRGREKPCNKKWGCEIQHRLGAWYDLLEVSTQVRALTLRLCFNGSHFYPKGFCISSFCHRSFEARIHKLGKMHQIVAPDSVVGAKKVASLPLEHQYKKFPKIYPELERYATYAHGIRKIFIAFDFLTYLHFFKVPAVETGGWLQSEFMTCDIFDRMPYLNEIIIQLPTELHDRKHKSFDVRVRGPPWRHPLSPCPRMLGRMIYEQIAERLATFEKVDVWCFIDDNEEHRFDQLRRVARRTLNLSRDDLIELYQDDQGGIEVTENSENFNKRLSSDIVTIKSTDYGSTNEAFPPICNCDEPCERDFLRRFA